MKITIKIFGLVAMVAVVWLLASCAEDPSISIHGVPTAGHQLTAAVDGGGPWQGNFTWEFSSTNGPHNWQTWWGWAGTGNRIHGATSQNIELGTGPVGRWVRASRRLENGDTIFSNVLGPISPPATPVTP